MARMDTARLLIDPPMDGPSNMARDEALLRACVDPDGGLVTRFYAWSPPAISLGYFQEYSEYENLPAPAGELPVVRRTTGGGAILHDREVTYSIVIPINHPLVRGRPNHLYEVAHGAIIDAVGHGATLFGNGREGGAESARRGPFFCFERRHALDVGLPDPNAPSGFAKIAGSAQRRTPTAILQHGSVIIESRFSQQACATWTGVEPDIDFERALQRLADAFARRLGVAARRTEWDEDLLRAARRLETRYTGAAWTVRRERRTAVG